mmetsp:Transcript_36905/g.68781  ORF Transcript_36905/g.68781 Transcript_36905/m.68781 type:complete len:82 (-) Transcript_36905:69-314(-)
MPYAIHGPIIKIKAAGPPKTMPNARFCAILSLQHKRVQTTVSRPSLSVFSEPTIPPRQRAARQHPAKKNKAKAKAVAMVAS